NELADHERQERDEDDDEAERYVVGVPAEAEAREQRREIIRDPRATECGGRTADQRNPDLDGREEALRLLAQPLHCPRTSLAAPRSLLNERLPHGDHRDLRTRE